MEKVMDKHVYRTNGKILILFIYLKYICSIVTIGNSMLTEVMTMSITVLLVIYFCIKNKFKINYKVMATILVITIFYFINLIIVPYKVEVISGYIQFITYNLIIILTIINGVDYNYVLNYWYKISKILTVATALIIVFKLQRNMNYMFIGIYNSYNSLILLYFLFNDHENKIKNVIFVGLTIAISLFGNRSAMLTIGLGIIVIFSIRRYNKNLKKLISNIGVYSILIALVINLHKILDLVILILNRININSYAVRKFIIMLEEGLASSSSGRDVLYDAALNIISSSKGLPRGIGYYYQVTGSQYPHNFILEWFIVFGVVVGSALLIILLYSIVSFIFKNKLNEEKKIFFILMLIYFFTRSLFSSSFLIERSFWIVIMMLVSQLHINKRRNRLII